MTEEIIFKVGVDNGDAVKSTDDVTKSLKGVDKATKATQQEFAGLRDEIKKQEKLVETLSKKWGENSTASDEARKSLGALNNQYKELTNSGVDLSARFEDVYGEMLPLSTQISEMEDRMYELARTNQTTGTEFQTLQGKVSEYKKIIIETDRAVDLLAEQGKGLGTALAIGTTVTAGYGALQGGMALLGDESEDLQKTFVKLQAVQTVLASLEQLKLSLDKQSIIVTKAKAVGTAIMTAGQYGQATATGVTTGATKALSKAMLAIPLVAILAGIMAVVGAMAYFNKEVEIAKDLNDKLNGSMAEQDAELAKRSAKIMQDTDNKIALAESEGATKEELHKMELERLRKEEVLRNVSTKVQLSQINKKKILYKQALKEGNDDLAKEIAEEIKQVRGKYQSLKALDGQYEVDKKILENKAKAERQAENEADAKERADKAKAWREKQKAEEEAEAQKKLERDRIFQDLMIQNIEDENLRKRTLMGVQFQREREDLIAKYGEDTELIKQLEEKQAGEVDAFNAELQAVRDAEKEEIAKAEQEQKRINAERLREDEKARLEGELIAMREDFEATQELKAELALMEMETALEQENLTEGEKFKIKEEYNAKLMALEESSAERKKQIDKDAMETSVAIAEQGNNAIQSLSDLVFDLKGRNLEKGSAAEEKAAKKQFKVNKALQLSMAIVDGFKSITTSLSQSPLAIGPIPNPAGIASLAFAAVTTGVNIAKIASSKFKGSGGGGGGASAPSVRPPSIPSQADISGGTENEGTLTGGLTDNNAPPANKVVLVDSDVKAGLANEAKVEMISTFG